MKEILSFICTYWIQILSSMVIAYLLGSISTSIIITKIVAKNADIRKMGSGNAGFTNVLRSVGKLPAILTFVGDFIKCVLAIVSAWLIFSTIEVDDITKKELVKYAAYLAGICCILGHLYPCYFGFKGGKGVVTTAAMMVLIDWRVFLIILAIFAVIFFTTKTISKASVTVAFLYPFVTFGITYFVDYLPSKDIAGGTSLSYVTVATIIAFCIGLLVIIKHRENIKRIIAGTEKKITAKKKDE